MPSLTNGKGQSTGAIYGVVNMLQKLRQQYHPKYMAVVFDPKGKTFRDDIYEEYKANRPPMPDDLRSQIDPIHNLILSLGLPKICISGFEADDVIASLAFMARDKNFDVVISTGDKDMAQLVDDKITLVNTMNETVMDRDGVIEKFGVPPERIIDYLALMGDSSDNIPGIPGVGPKTAAKWLNKYGSLEEIIKHNADIGGKVGDNLRQHLDQLPMAYKLATIVTDVETGVKLSDLEIKSPDTKALREQYLKWQFKTWLRQLDRPDEEEEQETSLRQYSEKLDYITILDNKTFDSWLKKLQQCKIMAFDTETTSLDYMQAKLVGMSFSVKGGEAAYLPIGHDYLDAPQQLKDALEKLKPILEDDKIKKLGHNLKYDINVLSRHGVHLKGVSHDSMLESYVFSSTGSRHDLDSVAMRYLNYQTITFESIAGKGAQQKTFNEISLDQAAPYAAEDADISLQLHEKLWSKMQKEAGLSKLYQELEVPLISVLADMEQHGVLIDDKLLAEQSQELDQRIAELEKKAHKLAKEEFNLGSPKQLQQILYEKLNLPVLRKTPKKQPSTAEDVLQELAWDYPLPKVILEYRGLVKLKTTYVDKLPQMIQKESGRVHTSYHQAVAATGRLSSSDPNLQNIPIRTPEGRRVRDAFIAPKDHQIISADYSQIELRIMAHLSGDKNLNQAFSQGKDIHTATAAEIFAVAQNEVDEGQRRSAKAINFGLIYGMSAFGLARQLGIERSAAQEYMDLYFERYPGVREFMDKTRDQARTNLFVETLYGRRLHLPEINSRNYQRRQYAERTAINAPMQGTAADIIKRAMITIHNWVKKEKVKVQMIMQVHDELIFEVHDSIVEECQKPIIQAMTQAGDLSVPLEVHLGVGKNWGDAH